MLVLADLFENDLYLVIAAAIMIIFILAIILIYIFIHKDNKKFLNNISSYNEDN